MTGEDWGGLFDSSELGVTDPVWDMEPWPEEGPSSRLTGEVCGGWMWPSSMGREGKDPERVETGGRLWLRLDTGTYNKKLEYFEYNFISKPLHWAEIWIDL